MDISGVRLSSMSFPGLVYDLKMHGANRNTDSFIVKKIDGLDPVPSDIISTPLASGGAYYSGKRLQTRELVILIGLNPNPTLSQTTGTLRDYMYKLYGVMNDQVNVELMGSGTSVLASTKGTVKNVELVLFDEDPTVQVTVFCPSPYFEGTKVVTVPPPGTKSLTGVNPGNAPSGFYIEAKLLTATTIVTFKSTSNTSFGVIAPPGNFLVNDILKINTTPGSRRFIATRGSLNHSLLHTVSKNTTWGKVPPGSYDISEETGYTNIEIIRFEFTPLYWGV